MAQQSTTEPTFVLNPDRQFVYVQFDHVGPGSPRAEGEGPVRVWLRLVNNCAIPIEVRAGGFAEGHKPADEVPILEDVVRDPPLRIVIYSGTKPPTETKKKPEPTQGYESDVSGIATIRPGKNILFSLPTTQFAEGWHIEIPYKFHLPQGKGPRPNDIGGEPLMHLEYSLWDLPSTAQNQVKDENTKLRH